MKKIILLLSLSLTTLITLSQPDIGWKRNLGGSGNDQAWAIQLTTDGGYIIAGQSGSPVSGDVTGPLQGGVDVWIVKTDSYGEVLWQKSYGGSGADQAYGIQQTSDGGYIVTGSTSSPNDGHVSGMHISGSAQDFWVFKIDASGTLLWQKTLGGTRIDFSRAVIETDDGHYVVAGAAQSSDGDLSSSRPGGTGLNHDFWVVKLNSATGDIIWDKAFGGTNSDQANSIQQTTDGGYIVVGFTESTDGQVTGFHGGSGDYWVVKLDSDGELVWQKTLGGEGNDQARSVMQTADGGYIVAGQSNSPVGDNSDVTGPAQGSTDVWVVKLDASGNIVWDKSYGGSSSDVARAIRPTTDGGYIITGYTVSNNTGDVTGFQGGFGDYWVIKTDASGNLMWQKALGGTGYDDAADIIEVPGGDYIVAGMSDSTNGDIEGANKGSYDYWIVKLGSACSPVTSTLTASACGSYTWTAGNGQTYNSSTTAEYIIENGATNGCDSIVTLNLTINQPTSHTIIANSCGTYSLNGVEYLSTGIYEQILENAAGCDSILTLNLTIHQPTSYTLTVTECGPFTLNGETYTTSGTYTQMLTNANNCDSTITLNLTITPLTYLVVLSGNTIMASGPNGATYQWIDCNTNTPIPGAINQNYTPAVNGSYAVVITANGCSATSECVSVSIVSVDEMQQSSWSVYPNPTSGKLIISNLQASGNQLIEIYSAQGQLIHSTLSTGIQTVINMDEFANGIYLIKVNQRESFRVVKI